MLVSTFLAGLLGMGFGQAPPVPPDSSAIEIAADNCPVVVTGTVRAYQYMPFHFEASAGNVLLLSMEDPGPELVFELSSEAAGSLVSGAGFGEGDVRIALANDGVYTLNVMMRGDYARQGTASDFRLRLFLRDNVDAGPCQTG